MLKENMLHTMFFAPLLANKCELCLFLISSESHVKTTSGEKKVGREVNTRFQLFSAMFVSETQGSFCDTKPWLRQIKFR